MTLQIADRKRDYFVPSVDLRVASSVADYRWVDQFFYSLAVANSVNLTII